MESTLVKVSGGPGTFLAQGKTKFIHAGQGSKFPLETEGGKMFSGLILCYLLWFVEEPYRQAWPILK